MNEKRFLFQVLFVDDDPSNIRRADPFCETLLIKPRTGMTDVHMKLIEDRCAINKDTSVICNNVQNDNYNAMSLPISISTPKTVQAQTTKQYTNDYSDEGKPPIVKKKNGWREKYEIVVPDWFENCVNNEQHDQQTPDHVIMLSGRQTPSESEEPQLNVPKLLINGGAGESDAELIDDGCTSISLNVGS